MRYLSLREILDLHEALLGQSGGATGIRDLDALESAMAQPRARSEAPTYIRLSRAR